MLGLSDLNADFFIANIDEKVVFLGIFFFTVLVLNLKYYSLNLKKERLILKMCIKFLDYQKANLFLYMSINLCEIKLLIPR